MSLTRLSAFKARLDSLLQGVVVEHLSDMDRSLAVREAVREYDGDTPRIEPVEFSGSGNSYYLLYGRVVDTAESRRNAAIDLGSSHQWALRFSLAQAAEVEAAQVYLQRLGATTAGTLTAAIHAAGVSAPGEMIVDGLAVEIDEGQGVRRGVYGWTRFDLLERVELPAGDYDLVLRSSGYTYANGSNEVTLGVEQGAGVTNAVRVYNGTSWSDASPASAAIVRVMGSLPGFAEGRSAVAGVEYPAAVIAAGEEPQMLEAEEWEVVRATGATWLRLIGLTPSSAETVRLALRQMYVWQEGADPVIDTPEAHFEAICNLAGSHACLRLAVRYGQNRDSGISADGVERRSQSEIYQSLARRFRDTYVRILVKREREASQAVVDVDYGPEEFLFHGRRRR